MNSHSSPISNPLLQQQTIISDSQDSSLSQQQLPGSSQPLPRYVPSSSNISNATTAAEDTELTSPTSSGEPSSQSQSQDTAPPTTRPLQPPSPVRAPDRRPVHAPAPRIGTDTGLQTGDTAVSPMSVDFPALTQGSKRTASGALKNSGSAEELSPTRSSAHKRHISVDSAMNSNRIGELSAQLRTRLSYAMMKVQNGWEKRSIEELEEQTSQKGSPISAPAQSEAYKQGFDSPGQIARHRRPSGMSDGSDHRVVSSSRSSPSYQSRGPPPMPSSNWGTGIRHPLRNQEGDSSFHPPADTASSNAPVLAPAAEIGSRRKRRSSASHAPPPLLSAQRKYYSDLTELRAGPRTPNAAPAPRPGILRMPSQQDEKDAVDTLLFMSSPKNSGRIHHSNLEPQPSPLKTEMVPPRRVVFDSSSNVHFSARKHSVSAEAQGGVEEASKERIENESRAPMQVAR